MVWLPENSIFPGSKTRRSSSERLLIVKFLLSAGQIYRYFFENRKRLFPFSGKKESPPAVPQHISGGFGEGPQRHSGHEPEFVRQGGMFVEKIENAFDGVGFV